MAEQKATHKSVVITTRFRVTCSGLFWQVRLAPTSLQSRELVEAIADLQEKRDPCRVAPSPRQFAPTWGSQEENSSSHMKKTTQLNYCNNTNSLKLHRISLSHPVFNHSASFWLRTRLHSIALQKPTGSFAASFQEPKHTNCCISPGARKFFTCSRTYYTLS